MAIQYKNWFTSAQCPELAKVVAQANENLVHDIVAQMCEQVAAAPDFADSAPQRENRPIRADGQAGKVALRLLRIAYLPDSYNSLTIQNVQVILHNSNCPDRRLREAVRWLEGEGCEVIKEWVKTDINRYMRWRVVWNAAAEKALAKLEQQKA